jgi:hypothetical protein
LYLSYLTSKITHDRRNALASIRLPSPPTVLSAISLQRRSQSFQSHPASFFTLSRRRSFVLNTFQPLFTKTVGVGYNHASKIF